MHERVRVLEVLTPYEVRDKLGVSLNTVYRMLRRKEMPGVKTGARWYVEREAFYRWLADEWEAPTFLHRRGSSEPAATNATGSLTHTG